FVPSRKQCPLVVNDLPIHYAVDDKPDRLFNTKVAGLKETLKPGIGYFHEAMDKQDERIGQHLSESEFVRRSMVDSRC
ncbi:hypothetical protein EDD85DRAFT_996243, partial [Armillaria nabsnona]